MPFDEEKESDEEVSPKSKKIGIKNVSSQKSIFDSMQKKSTQEDLDKSVKHTQERASAYKIRAADLATQFNRFIADKTLSQNKNVFQRDTEKELMTKMIQLAIEINDDPDEAHGGMGSLGWVALLMRTCFAQRDKINKLEYIVYQLDKKITLIEENSKPVDKETKSG